ncbi:MAG: 30S ribosomal protein S1 [Candidatus Firestonebacteria bacterium]
MFKEELNSNEGGEDVINMSTLMSEAFSDMEEGKLIKARVVRVGQDKIIVDIGYKSDGAIPVKEFYGADGKLAVKVGDEVEVMIDRFDDHNGNIVLSKTRADGLKHLDALEKAYNERDVVDGKIIREIKGGFLADIGAEAFLPQSQFVAEEAGADFLGKSLPMKIIKFGRKRGEIVVSHKVAVKDKSKRLKKETWDSLAEGEVRKGIVKSITSYGAFIDIGGVTGLLHISDMSWGKVTHPAEILALESEVEVKVIKIDREKKRVSFGLKQLQEDPWGKIELRYSIGSTIRGRVVNIVDYGAFIKLEEGIEGLLHVSDLSWTRKAKNPSELVAVGDTIQVKVLNIDKNNRKILFGLKQLENDPFAGAEEKFPAGARVSGVVSGYSASSIFLELEGGIEAVLHKKDLSWTKRFPTLKGIYRKGERVETVVLELDKANRKVQVGAKQLTQDPWISEIPAKYKEGAVVSAKVVRTANFGVFLELEPGLDGFIHVSELSVEPVDNAESVVKVDEEKKAKVIKLDIENRKINLSVKALLVAEERQELKKYTNTGDGKATFGDILNKPQ